MISDILRDHGMGKGLKAADKQALIDIVNAADANQSAVKTDIVNKLKAKDAALPITSASSWADILAQIPNLYVGKKWATGTKNTNSSYILSIRGLAFSPNVVLVQLTTGSTYLYITAYVAKSQYLPTSANDIAARTQNGSINGITFTKYSDGFDIQTGSASAAHDWVAFE